MTKDRRQNPWSENQQGLFESPVSGTFGLGIDFNTEVEDGFVNERGETLIHRMGISCPHCRRGSKSDPIFGPHIVSTCPYCDGKGWIYRNPRLIMGIVTGIQSNRRWVDIGFLNPGDCTVSTSPKLYPPISDFDLITFTWPQPLDDGQVIVRGDDYEREKEFLRRENVKKLAENEDRLLYTAAQSLWVEDDSGRAYVEDTDFVFDGKVVRWLNVPTKGTRISLKYQCYYDWICLSSPFERRDQGKTLGPRVALRKIHIAFLAEDPHLPNGILGETLLSESSVKV